MMSSQLDGREQYTQLIDLLRSKNSVLVAFSGGVDSSLLLAASREALRSRVLAVTVRSCLQPAREEEQALEAAAFIGARHIFVNLDLLSDGELQANRPDRCYLCKRRVFRELRALAGREKFEHIIEGSNRDDLDDHRPGSRALKELGICSPFIEVGLTKQMIYTLAQSMKLPTCKQPSLACLASRIPFGVPITKDRLRRIDAAEDAVRALGIEQVRVRDHDTIARVEVPEKDIPGLINDSNRSRLIRALKEQGYRYVAIDLEGYRTGSMNAVVNDSEKEGDAEPKAPAGG
ncbi:MAG: ATP-dependent sacrificial sulfur transferase LarE [Candidatus Eisenbacteria sp.]|nr:ATP-dependent sacrificial sulfur transferase LarE [Candidatus Eisenbacteria bacterium]